MRPLTALLLAVPCALLLAFVPADDNENPGQLETVMDALKSNLKALAGSVSSVEQNEQSLEALTAMQAWALKGKLLLPANLDTVPEADQAAHIAAFRATMLELVIDLAGMEIDVLEGRNDVANEKIRNQLLALRDAAHDEFQNH